MYAQPKLADDFSNEQHSRAPSAVKGQLPDKKYITDMQTQFASIKTVVDKVGNTWAPWKKEKNSLRSKQAVAEIDKQTQSVMEALNQLLGRLATAEAAAVTAEGLRAASEQKAAEQVQTVAALQAQVATLKKEKDEAAALAAKLDEAMNSPRFTSSKRLSSRSPSSNNLNTEGGGASVSAAADLPVSARIDAILRENDKLKAENEKLTLARSELTNKIKELTDKARDEAGAHERTLKRINSDLRKTCDEKESELQAAKSEVSEQQSVRTREVNQLQKRLEAVKAELDMMKIQEAGIRGQMEKAAAAAAKATEESKAAQRKAAAEVKAVKDEQGKLLELARAETAAVSTEYQLVSRLVVDKLGVKSLPVMRHIEPQPEGSYINPSTTKAAFTLRCGCVLHNHACSPAISFSNVEPFKYEDNRELADLLANKGFVLCPTCKGF